VRFNWALENSPPGIDNKAWRAKLTHEVAKRTYEKPDTPCTVHTAQVYQELTEAAGYRVATSNNTPGQVVYQDADRGVWALRVAWYLLAAAIAALWAKSLVVFVICAIGVAFGPIRKCD
jgi:hypothetical protein